LDDQHVGGDRYETQCAVDNRCSQHHAWYGDRSILDLSLV
jgi:hypothetical protein